MKVAVPVSGETLCSHFGQSTQFAFFEVDQATGAILSRQDLAAPAHAPGVLPTWLSAQGANLVIAGGMGAHARALLAQHQVAVVTGAPESDARAVVSSYLSGVLATDDHPCTSHEHSCGD